MTRDVIHCLTTLEEHAKGTEESRPRTSPFVSTRHGDVEPIPYDPEQPRLGRRESEPHAEEIQYLFDVLSTNFPGGRATRDLHHYFTVEGVKYDLQFDLSFFPTLQVPYTLSSFNAERFGGQVPTLAVNVLSRRTWQVDVGLHVEYCRDVGVPVYVVFPAYHVATRRYEPPFLRAYVLQASGDYHVQEMRAVAMREGEAWVAAQNLIGFGELLPFRLGLVELVQPPDGGLKHYRLALFRTDEPVPYPTSLERVRQQLDRERAKADELAEKLRMCKEKFGKL
ncbi:MAG: hypothetical protein Kow0069_25900 [Promethearchaeota archaeon]